MNSRIILLTGGIATGKTTVSCIFADQYQIPTIDTDQIARYLTQNTHALGQKTLCQIQQLFPDVIDHDQQLNRAALRQRIFHDHSAKKALESLLHPLILQQALREIEAITTAYCIIAVPLLSQTSAYLSLGRVVLATTLPLSIQIQRLCQRDNISEQLAVQIIKCQPSQTDYQQLADYMLDTSLSFQTLQTKIATLYSLILSF